MVRAKSPKKKPPAAKKPSTKQTPPRKIDALAGQVAKLSKRITALESAEAVAGLRGPKNQKGEKGDPGVRELLSRTSLLHLEPLPPYAPELNPDEGVWNHLESTLANGRPDTQEELMDVLAKEICRLGSSQHLLRACIQQSDLPPFLS